MDVEIAQKKINGCTKIVELKNLVRFLNRKKCKFENGMDVPLQISEKGGDEVL